MTNGRFKEGDRVVINIDASHENAIGCDAVFKGAFATVDETGSYRPWVIPDGCNCDRSHCLWDGTVAHKAEIVALTEYEGDKPMKVTDNARKNLKLAKLSADDVLLQEAGFENEHGERTHEGTEAMFDKLWLAGRSGLANDLRAAQKALEAAETQTTTENK